MKREEFEAEQAADRAHKMLLECQESYDRMLPSLKEALQLVSALTKKDIAELRSLNHPPNVIVLVLTAVCMIMGIPPEDEFNKESGKYELSYWKASLGPNVLGKPTFSEEL